VLLTQLLKKIGLNRSIARKT